MHEMAMHSIHFTTNQYVLGKWVSDNSRLLAVCETGLTGVEDIDILSCIVQNCFLHLFKVTQKRRFGYIAGISHMLCLCYCFLCVLYTLAYVWRNDHVNSCLHIDFFIECRPHIHQRIQRTEKVGTFVEQISDFSCVALPRNV